MSINVEQDDIIIDGPVLSRALRRQARLWFWLGPLLTGLLLLLGLCFFPTAHTADVSLAIQQPPTMGGSTLAMLAGGGGPGKVYLGFLKSRQAAQDVERHVHLQQMYFPGPDTEKNRRKTLDMLMQAVKPEDSATDGLLYIHVTLPGPARFSLNHSLRSDDVKQAAALAANSYALALKEYYATNDVDQGAELLRGADSEERRRRADYEAALERLLAFNRSLRGVDPRSAPTSLSDTGDTNSGIGALYTALAQVQAELRANEVVRQTRNALTNRMLGDLSDVPGDDQLLAGIRNQVKQDQADYRTFSNLYGPENSKVIGAQMRLGVDEAELSRQVAGVRQRLTTPDIRSDEQIQALYKRQALLIAQIADAKRRLGLHRTLSGEFGRLQTEVDLRLEILKATLAEAAKIRLDNASAKNRMTIIDPAIPPTGSGAAWIKIILISVVPVFLLFLFAVTRQYLRDVQAAPRTALPLAASSANGMGMKTDLESEPKVKETRL